MLPSIVNVLIIGTINSVPLDTSNTHIIRLVDTVTPYCIQYMSGGLSEKNTQILIGLLSKINTALNTISFIPDRDQIAIIDGIIDITCTLNLHTPYARALLASIIENRHNKDIEPVFIKACTLAVSYKNSSVIYLS